MTLDLICILIALSLIDAHLGFVECFQCEIGQNVNHKNQKIIGVLANPEPCQCNRLVLGGSFTEIPIFASNPMYFRGDPVLKYRNKLRKYHDCDSEESPHNSVLEKTTASRGPAIADTTSGTVSITTNGPSTLDTSLGSKDPRSASGSTSDVTSDAISQENTVSSDEVTPTSLSTDAINDITISTSAIFSDNFSMRFSTATNSKTSQSLTVSSSAVLATSDSPTAKDSPLKDISLKPTTSSTANKATGLPQATIPSTVMVTKSTASQSSSTTYPSATNTATSLPQTTTESDVTTSQPLPTLQFCNDTLGMENGLIPDSSITASSQDSWATAAYGRLNSVRYWYPSAAWNEAWIQADIGYATPVSGIMTQGDNGVGLLHEWPVSVKIATKTDIHGQMIFFLERPGVPKVFPANVDATTTVTVLFPTPTQARVVRIACVEVQGACKMRFEILGCK